MDPIGGLIRADGRVALVTGAAKGIGEAIARRLAEAGAVVAVADLDAEVGSAVVRSIGAEGGRAELFRVDVSDLEQDRALVAEVVRRLGGLDILVNNAGIFPFSPALRTTPQLWDSVLSVNLRAAFFLATASAPHLGRTRQGTIVNVASIDALRPSGNLAHYDASKAGLAMLTRSLALEFAPLGIRVNSVAPGGVDTPGVRATLADGPPMPPGMMEQFLKRIPMGRMALPDEIARAVLFLATPISSYVTGSMLVVDGGTLLG